MSNDAPHGFPPSYGVDRSALLAKRLRERRRALDRTQEEVAAAAHIAVVHLRRLERGDGNPRLSTLFALADALDCEISALIPD